MIYIEYLKTNSTNYVVEYCKERIIELQEELNAFNSSEITNKLKEKQDKWYAELEYELMYLNSLNWDVPFRVKKALWDYCKYLMGYETLAQTEKVFSEIVKRVL